MKGVGRIFSPFFLAFLLCSAIVAQELYTARGYWTELNKSTFKQIQDKQAKGQSLTDNETLYLKDYEQYLATYYSRMPEDERRLFETMREQWDNEAQVKPTEQSKPAEVDFELRTRDRLVNGLYGAYYGTSLAIIGEMNEAALVGVPLIMAGLWQLGPVINKKKYEGIDPSTIRAGNTGKFLGLGYGASLGWLVSAESETPEKWVLGLSTLGSITMGEIAFHAQKKKKFTEGHIELMRHYGIIGPVVSALGVLSFNPAKENLIGAALLGGGVVGLLIGNQQVKKYDYTMGDVDAISSLTLITMAAGFTVPAESIGSSDNYALLLIPMATAIGGTIWGQHAVRGANLTKRQGSTLNLSSGGAALVGLGVMALIGTESPALNIAVPTACALLTHQLIFHSYKTENIEKNLKIGRVNKHHLHLSLNVMPENYFSNKQFSEKIFHTTGQLGNPIVNLKLKF